MSISVRHAPRLTQCIDEGLTAVCTVLTVVNVGINFTDVKLIPAFLLETPSAPGDGHE